ncbi:NUDIX hydrolase [Flavobacterium difficile]|uniref:NUDIX domain-containing protein n=1 Tax=Flavobacterium difficile TaxID=2709659 RepID=A0ABX0I425_9FLAO|nr:NUDIX domain-containing protein [Flavobacterium difficile]NHM01564.1 NUDIX domain-containing protein [Flavobacterium difficile]
MKIIDKIAWIAIKNKTLLSTKSYGKKVFYIPGGKREQEESDADTLLREIAEELDVYLIQSTLNFVGIFEAQADGHEEGTVVRMTCYTGAYTGVLKASSEIECFEWLRYADKDKISEVDKLIFDFLYDQDLID